VRPSLGRVVGLLRMTLSLLSVSSEVPGRSSRAHITLQHHPSSPPKPTNHCSHRERAPCSSTHLVRYDRKTFIAEPGRVRAGMFCAALTPYRVKRICKGETRAPTVNTAVRGHVSPTAHQAYFVVPQGPSQALWHPKRYDKKRSHSDTSGIGCGCSCGRVGNPKAAADRALSASPILLFSRPS